MVYNSRRLNTRRVKLIAHTCMISTFYLISSTIIYLYMTFSHDTKHMTHYSLAIGAVNISSPLRSQRYDLPLAQLVRAWCLYDYISKMRLYFRNIAVGKFDPTVQRQGRRIETAVEEHDCIFNRIVVRARGSPSASPRQYYAAPFEGRYLRR